MEFIGIFSKIPLIIYNLSQELEIWHKLGENVGNFTSVSNPGAVIEKKSEFFCFL